MDNNHLHDFNNQLAIIQGFCELLLEDCAPDDPRRRDFEEIHRAATAARHLAEQLFPPVHTPE